MKKKLQQISAFALAVILCFSLGTPMVFASGDPMVTQATASNLMPGSLDTSSAYNYTNAPTDKWGVFAPELTFGGTWPAWEAGVNYGEIVDEGHSDVGSLHLVSAPGKNTGVVINPQMTIGETYTLGLWVKGTSNSGKVLAMYANGDPAIIGGAENLAADWSRYEVTFTANTVALQLFAADWGNTNIYIDNITLKNSEGVDLLEGYGDFYVVQSEDEEQVAIPSIDTTQPYNYTNAPTDKWGVFAPELTFGGTWPAWEAGVNYGEIVEEGNKDAGALHLVSAPGKNTGVVINPQMTIGETYTLSLWVKGTSNSGKVLAMYANGDPAIIGGAENLAADWSRYEVTFTANIVALPLFAVDWGNTNIYIDNITLKNSEGVDLLEGYGDFYVVQSEDEEQVAIPSIDTTQPYNHTYAPTDKWGVFAPELTFGGTWPAWEAGVNYGEIVEEGHSDVGSLHLVSAPGKNTGVIINPQMTIGETYTLGLWVKGTSNSGKVLAMYANGDPAIIGGAENLTADWSYYEVTFTANIVALPLFAVDWGNTNIYIDNITLKNSEGVDLLEGYGDFYVVQSEDEEQVVIPSIDTTQPYNHTNAPTDKWGVFAPELMYHGTWLAWEAGVNYGEIVEEGHSDVGSLHLVSAPGKNTGVIINPQMTIGETYTLGLWVKGTSNSGKVLAMYANGDPAIIGGAENLTADWSYYEVTFTANIVALPLFAVDWGNTNIYIDNITLKNSEGVDLLEGYGDFYVVQSEDEEQVAIPSIDTTQPYNDTNAPTDKWGVFAPELMYHGTWPAWEAGVNYGEIVEEGHSDVGSLHLVSAPGKNTGVVINPKMVIGETYTLGLWVKGTSNSGKVLAMYANGDPAIIGGAENLTADWSHYEVTFTANTVALQLFAADWGNTNIYIDNITLKNSAGVDLLTGYGDFKPAMLQWQLMLGEDIGVKFVSEIPEEQKEDVVVTITVNEQSTSYTANDMTYEDGKYSVLVNVAAAQMTDEIAVEVKVADVTVWNKTYTVRQYADYILSGDYDDTTKALVKEMLSYGAAAQNYFDYHRNALATEGVDMFGTGAAEIPETANELAVNGKVTGLAFYGASLVFESKTAVRFYFTGDVADCSFAVNGNALAVKEKGDLYYVEIGQINPAELSEDITVTVTSGDASMTITYSPMNYMVRMNGKTTTSDNLKVLLKAMYNYHLAATEI